MQPKPNRSGLAGGGVECIFHKCLLPHFFFPCLYLTRFSVAHHPCAPPALLLPAEVLLLAPLTPHTLHFLTSLLHASVSLHGFLWATRLWGSDEDTFFGAVILAPVMTQAKSPMPACCTLWNGFRTAKIQTLPFSFTPCHYRLLEKWLCSKGF